MQAPTCFFNVIFQDIAVGTNIRLARTTDKHFPTFKLFVVQLVQFAKVFIMEMAPGSIIVTETYWSACLLCWVQHKKGQKCLFERVDPCH